jgi:hypothetical protein
MRIRLVALAVTAAIISAVPFAGSLHPDKKVQTLGPETPNAQAASKETADFAVVLVAALVLGAGAGVLTLTGQGRLLGLGLLVPAIALPLFVGHLPLTSIFLVAACGLAFNAKSKPVAAPSPEPEPDPSVAPQAPLFVSHTPAGCPKGA